MEHFEIIKENIEHFNEQVRAWNLDNLTEEELDEIDELLEETMSLLSGGEEAEDEEEDEDY